MNNFIIDSCWNQLQKPSPLLYFLKADHVLSHAECDHIFELRNEYNITLGREGLEFKATIIMLLLAEAGEL